MLWLDEFGSCQLNCVAVPSGPPSSLFPLMSFDWLDTGSRLAVWLGGHLPKLAAPLISTQLAMCLYKLLWLKCAMMQSTFGGLQCLCFFFFSLVSYFEQTRLGSGPVTSNIKWVALWLCCMLKSDLFSFWALLLFIFTLKSSLCTGSSAGSRRPLTSYTTTYWSR